jgi:hypothetical protein
MENVEQITVFGSRLKNPVVLDVKTDGNNIYFNVINKSQYLYGFEVKFGEFGNLSPRVFEKKTTLLPGPNRLFSFKIVNPEEPPMLSYQTKYYLSGTNSNGLRFNPYLIPIGPKRTVRYQSIQSGSIKKIMLGNFEMNQGDTIYSARKGTITALPDNTVELDRLINNSIEVRHDDGTVAVYLGADPNLKLVKPGQTIYPGQAIGLVSSGKLLIFKVFEIQGEGKLKNIDILYSGNNSQLVDAKNIEGTRVSYSPDIIKKEMTKKEISKFGKKSLFIQ